MDRDTLPGITKELTNDFVKTGRFLALWLKGLNRLVKVLIFKAPEITVVGLPSQQWKLTVTIFHGIPS
ncbi:hypothetical protein ONS95_014736 [Cadophora gregata]|uniref:uncharacterized protein n=1 Tax=Cadophora gregata TaxID=51156 RepID=UPI0026DCF77E|nr:uncharacterized protein ONS95_014736 [Cadophora gregata]KAK0113026.1 hypothetical protein ONS95_014736 [Cadophora gregata]KAK0125147.1 hypothetical protein ONS96_009011 [Cadophora gregata f. sp. sojae]